MTAWGVEREAGLCTGKLCPLGVPPLPQPAAMCYMEQSTGTARQGQGVRRTSCRKKRKANVTHPELPIGSLCRAGLSVCSKRCSPEQSGFLHFTPRGSPAWCLTVLWTQWHCLRVAVTLYGSFGSSLLLGEAP